MARARIALHRQRMVVRGQAEPPKVAHEDRRYKIGWLGWTAPPSFATPSCRSATRDVAAQARHTLRGLWMFTGVWRNRWRGPLLRERLLVRPQPLQP